MAKPLRSSLDLALLTDAVHTLMHATVSRSHYPAGHPAIERAEQHASAVWTSLLERVPELVIALVEGEFVVQDRPLPELQRRAPGFRELLERHDLECIVFVRGFDHRELGALTTALAAPPPPRAEGPRARERLQQQTRHALLRYVEVHGEGGAANATRHDRGGKVGQARVYTDALGQLTSGRAVHVAALRSLAEELLRRAERRELTITHLAYAHGDDLSAAHAENVAAIAATMAIASGLSDAIAVDVVAGAYLHDVGHALLPPELRGIPSPLLPKAHRVLFEYHPYLGARALLEAGAPPLWVAAALEHHRGVDRRGYPQADEPRAPHEVARIVGLANYFDRRRTSIDGAADSPRGLLARMRSLEGRYFERRHVELLLASVGLHPPGTVVRLSDGRLGEVVRANPADPERPEVRPMFEEAAELVDERGRHNPRDGRHAITVIQPVAPPLVLHPEADEERRAAREANAAWSARARESARTGVARNSFAPAAPAEFPLEPWGDSADALDGLDDLVGSALDGLDAPGPALDREPSGPASAPPETTSSARVDDALAARTIHPSDDGSFASLDDELGRLLDGAFGDLSDEPPDRESSSDAGASDKHEPPVESAKTGPPSESRVALPTADEAPPTPREQRPLDAFDAPTRVAFAAVALPDDEAPPSSMHAPSTGLRLGPRTSLLPPASTRTSPTSPPTDEPNDDER